MIDLQTGDELGDGDTVFLPLPLPPFPGLVGYELGDGENTVQEGTLKVPLKVLLLVFPEISNFAWFSDISSTSLIDPFHVPL